MFDRDDERGVGAAAGFAGAGAAVGRGATPAPDWRQLDRQLRGIARRRAALDAEEARWLVLAQQLELHRRFGYATLLEYLERTLGYGPRAARERLRVATALQVLPATAAALACGDHAYSAVRELTRVCRQDTERVWLDAVAGKTVHEIETMVAGRKPGDLPGDPVDPEDVRKTLVMELSAETFAVGALVYFNTSTKLATSTVGSNPVLGHAIHGSCPGRTSATATRIAVSVAVTRVDA